MKFLVRAFAIMAAVNVAAILWMGLVLGDWNPANLDSLVRDFVGKWIDQGPLFWAAYILGLIVFETLVFLLALLLSAAAEGVFWSTLLVTLALLGLVSLKAWDVQRNVKNFKKQVIKAAEKTSDNAGDALKDGWKKMKDTVNKP
jgi:hypothetical protein